MATFAESDHTWKLLLNQSVAWQLFLGTPYSACYWRLSRWTVVNYALKEGVFTFQDIWAFGPFLEIQLHPVRLATISGFFFIFLKNHLKFKKREFTFERDLFDF